MQDLILLAVAFVIVFEGFRRAVIRTYVWLENEEVVFWQRFLITFIWAVMLVFSFGYLVGRL
jgi:hypothetical protein